MSKHLVWTECSRCKSYAVECCDIEDKPVCHVCYGDTHDCFLEITHEVYQKDGQSGVFKWVLERAPFLKWMYCEPCEIDSPVKSGVCVVCWSPIEVSPTERGRHA
jgi:hypothetical protein